MKAIGRIPKPGDPKVIIGPDTPGTHVGRPAQGRGKSAGRVARKATGKGETSGR